MDWPLLLKACFLLILSTRVEGEAIKHNLPDNLEIIDPKSLGLSGSDLDKFLGNVKLLPVGGNGLPGMDGKTQILTVGFDGDENINLEDFEPLSTGGLKGQDAQVAEMAFKSFKDFFKSPDKSKNIKDVGDFQDQISVVPSINSIPSTRQPYSPPPIRTSVQVTSSSSHVPSTFLPSPRTTIITRTRQFPINRHFTTTTTTPTPSTTTTTTTTTPTPASSSSSTRRPLRTRPTGGHGQRQRRPGHTRRPTSNNPFGVRTTQEPSETPSTADPNPTEIKMENFQDYASILKDLQVKTPKPMFSAKSKYLATKEPEFGLKTEYISKYSNYFAPTTTTTTEATTTTVSSTEEVRFEDSEASPTAVVATEETKTEENKEFFFKGNGGSSSFEQITAEPFDFVSAPNIKIENNRAQISLTSQPISLPINTPENIRVHNDNSNEGQPQFTNSQTRAQIYGGFPPSDNLIPRHPDEDQKQNQQQQYQEQHQQQYQEQQQQQQQQYKEPEPTRFNQPYPSANEFMKNFPIVQQPQVNLGFAQNDYINPNQISSSHGQTFSQENLRPAHTFAILPQRPVGPIYTHDISPSLYNQIPVQEEQKPERPFIPYSYNQYQHPSQDVRFTQPPQQHREPPRLQNFILPPAETSTTASLAPMHIVENPIFPSFNNVMSVTTTTERTPQHPQPNFQTQPTPMPLIPIATVENAMAAHINRGRYFNGFNNNNNNNNNNNQPPPLQRPDQVNSFNVHLINNENNFSSPSSQKQFGNFVSTQRPQGPLPQQNYQQRPSQNSNFGPNPPRPSFNFQSQPSTYRPQPPSQNTIGGPPPGHPGFVKFPTQSLSQSQQQNTFSLNSLFNFLPTFHRFSSNRGPPPQRPYNNGPPPHHQSRPNFLPTPQELNRPNYQNQRPSPGFFSGPPPPQHQQQQHQPQQQQQPPQQQQQPPQQQQQQEQQKRQSQQQQQRQSQQQQQQQSQESQQHQVGGFSNLPIYSAENRRRPNDQTGAGSDLSKYFTHSDAEEVTRLMGFRPQQISRAPLVGSFSLQKPN